MNFDILFINRPTDYRGNRRRGLIAFWVFVPSDHLRRSYKIFYTREQGHCGLFSQVDSCRYWLIGRLTVNRRVISFFHSPVLLYAVLAFYLLTDVIYKFFSMLFVRVYSIFVARLVRCNVSTDPNPFQEPSVACLQHS